MKKIAIINTLPVPSGNASVNRFLSYAKGMVKLGDSITVLSSSHHENRESIIDGVRCVNFGSKSILSLFNSLLYILSNLFRGKYNSIILVSNSLLLIYSIAFIAKLKGIKLLQEKSEFPFVLMKNGFFNKLKASIYVNTTYKLFDGLIVMTKPLMDYFKNKVSLNCKIIEVPMTVDVSRFTIQREKSEIGDYIAYCGNMSGNKDGIYNLISAFSFVEKAGFQIRLLLIGGTDKQEDFDAIRNYVSEQSLSNVVFYGRATRDEIPQLLVNAKVLALARPSSLQSTGGFPTKLGEYLSTGNPVVVTAVGDIPLYLNNKNSFIVEPDNNEAFAERIIEVLNNYEEATKKALIGKELVENIFNSEVQARRLHEYLKQF